MNASLQLKHLSQTLNQVKAFVLLLKDDLVIPTVAVDTHQSVLQQYIFASGFKAEQGESLNFYSTDNTGLSYFIFGIGNGDLSVKQINTLAASIYKATNKNEQVYVDTTFIANNYLSPLLLAVLNASYSFNAFKTKAKPVILNTIYVADSIATDLLTQLNAIHIGQNTARQMGNLPGNYCYPEFFAQQAVELAAQYPNLIKVTVLTEDDMLALGMNTFLAVSKGSDKPGRLVSIEYSYQKTNDTKPVVLVGKGVTFDTGGISLKPAAGMEEMIYDMSGAGSVMGVMRALCELQLPVSVVGVMACAENMPSGKATRPGDVVTSMSGQTVEILNTDAEGRLVLCDTLTYVDRFNPAVVIDIATLTGACVVALGKVVSGLFSNNDDLAQDIFQAGNQIADRVWRMPLLEDYQELLDSNMADMANIGGPTAGAITAACFLARYTKNYTWAHLDIAGVSNLSGAQKGSTGRPVPLLMQYLINYAAKQN